MEDGFPETLDLSAYYINGDKSEKKVRAGMSVFATEYERLHGDLKEGESTFICQVKIMNYII